MKPHHCGHCGYELIGLAKRGTCPECGKPYSTSSISQSTHNDRGPIEQHAKAILLGIVGGLFLVCAGSVLVINKGGAGGLAAGLLVVALLFGFGAFATWQAERGDRR